MKYIMIGLFVVSTGCAGIQAGGFETERGEGFNCTLPDDKCVQKCTVTTDKLSGFFYREDPVCMSKGVEEGG